ncbi:acetylglutamate kinase [Staphylococcus edaphicus]|uniref:Acetylglutamate kinase n=1 Tax=Staphylococcus edaphicus TaxID=1955013 RepID=A0A2C6WQF1_9STAP|nr:acetylglutamate kinase [Staphylococcus edaphicus]PHK49966.1 acetylglutamate kinase [Staphylococcus edaphicus]UQW81773.1 acetylglutamate kinase [Staphylococcus edaphicus]
MSYIVIKIGGSTLTELHDTTIEDIAQLKQQGMRPIIVHGGGPFINQALKQQGVHTSFKDGLRVTTDKVLTITSQILVGMVNPQLVGKMNHTHIQSIGLNGVDAKLFDVKPLNEKYGYVGEAININTAVIDHITEHYIPIIASIGMHRSSSHLYNINADTLAYKIAQILKAPIYLLSDIPGVIIEDKVKPTLTSEHIQHYIEQEQIYGGMIPKVQEAVTAIEHGCQNVVIAAGNEAHVVQRIRDGQQLGTTIQL